MSAHVRGVPAIFAGVLVGIFQLVGRWQVGTAVGGVQTGWLFEIRLWVLTGLSLWLFATVAAQSPGARRFHVSGVQRWGVMIVLFVAYMILTSAWAPDATLAARKSYDLFLVAWSCVLAAAALRLYGTSAIVEAFWGTLFGLGVVLAVFGLTALFSGTGGTRLAALGGGPNVFGRNMALLTLASLRLVFDDRRWVRTPATIVAPVAALLVLLSGSRGAMLALFVGVVVYVVLRRGERRVRRSIAFVAIVGVGALATEFGRIALLVFQERFILLLLVEGYFTHRDTLLVDGLSAGLRNPVGGLGLAGFAQLGSKGQYPHNVFVEAFAEGGLVGLVLLCIPFFWYASRWKSGMGLGDTVTVAGLVVLMVSSSISGDLFDARGVFLLLVMGVAGQYPVVTHSFHRLPGVR